MARATRDPKMKSGATRTGTAGNVRNKRDVKEKLFISQSETASGTEIVANRKTEKEKTYRERKKAEGKPLKPQPKVKEAYSSDTKGGKNIFADLENPKSKRFQHYELILDEILEAFRLGLTLNQIAMIFAIDYKTLHAWYTLPDNVRFKDQIDSARRKADSRVVAALYDIATGNVAVHEMQWEEKKKDGAIVRHKTKQLAPNAYAALQWLSRRDPAHWSESEVVKKQIKQEFEELSDEQLNDMIERIMDKSKADKSASERFDDEVDAPIVDESEYNDSENE